MVFMVNNRNTKSVRKSFYYFCFGYFLSAIYYSWFDRRYSDVFVTENGINDYICFGIGIIFSIGIVWTIHKYVEKPIGNYNIKVLNKLFK